MNDRRTNRRFTLPAVAAAMVACAVPQSAAAQSRDYPPTYSSRKAPWYDPFRWFTDDPKPVEAKPVPKTAAPQANYAEAKWRHGIMPDDQGVPVVQPGFGPMQTAPVWNWYGYGAPSAPKAATLPVPSQIAKPLIEPSKPNVVIAPPVLKEGPRLTDANNPPPSDIDWKSSPGATIKLPDAEAAKPASPTPGPLAVLRMPSKPDEKPAEKPIAKPAYETPLSRISPPAAESKEIRVEAAPGIVVPK